MDARLVYAVERGEPKALDELSDVRLIRDTDAPPAGILPRGARGTIVAVHGAGEAYDVEFAEPFHALLMLTAAELEPVAGATRERLIAETGDVRR